MAAVAAGLMATASSFYQKGRGHSSSTSLETCIMQKCQISSLCERVGGFFFFWCQSAMVGPQPNGLSQRHTLKFPRYPILGVSKAYLGLFTW